MIDCQLATNGITAARVIDMFAEVPREAFLPEALRHIAYIDEDLPLAGDGVGGVGTMIEPVIHARMVQAAVPEATDSILNIGDETGYSSAILSGLVSTVVVLEPRTGCLDQARRVWDEHGYCNIAVINGVAKEGSAEHAPYDIIVLNGAVPVIPDVLLNQLTVGGRLVCVVKKPGMPGGSITVVEKVGDGRFSRRAIFDAATPYIPGFEPEPAFTF